MPPFSTFSTLISFQVLNPPQWSLAKQSSLKSWKLIINSTKTSWSQKGWCNKPTKVRWTTILNTADFKTQQINRSQRLSHVNIDASSSVHVVLSHLGLACDCMLIPVHPECVIFSDFEFQTSLGTWLYFSKVNHDWSQQLLQMFSLNPCLIVLSALTILEHIVTCSSVLIFVLKSKVFAGLYLLKF